MGSKEEYELYAYCLMSNHAHLLMKPLKLPLPTSMKRINVSYVHFYNKKHDRTGPLLDDRYKSVPIRDEAQFLTCARYIHNNPVKAGIESSPQRYPWSSFAHYLGADDPYKLPFNKMMLLAYYDYGSNPLKAIEQLREFTARQEDVLLPIQKLIAELLAIEGAPLSDITKVSPAIRNRIIRKVREMTGITATALAKATGINRESIYKA